MDKTPKRRSTLPIKIGAGIVVLLIYVGVTTYVKSTRDTKPADSANINSNSVTEISSTNSNAIAANPASNNSNASTAANSNTSTPSNKPINSNTNTGNSNTPANNTPAQPTTVYKNGTYNVTGIYATPEGQEKIGFVMTIQNDKITDVQAQVKAMNPTSKQYQNEFVGQFKSYVVGKNIADLNLGKVASSSLTNKGFNNALAQVKSYAKI